MKTSDSRNARTKFWPARPSSFDRPARAPAVLRPQVHAAELVEHGVLHLGLRRVGQQVGEHRDLALTREPVDVGRRRAGREVGDVVERHRAQPRRRHRQRRNRLRACSGRPAARGGAPRTARRLRCTSSPGRRRPAAAGPRPRRRSGTPMSAAFGRSSCTDTSGFPPFIDVSTSTTPGNLRTLRDELLAVGVELRQVRAVDDELDVGVLAAAAADVGDRLHGRPQVRRERRQHVLPDRVHDRELIAAPLLDRLQPDVDVAEVARLRRIAGDLHERVRNLGHTRCGWPSRRGW